MRRFILHNIDALIPLSFGFSILAFAYFQGLRKPPPRIDEAEKRARQRKRLQWAGFALLVVSAWFFAVEGFDRERRMRLEGAEWQTVTTDDGVARVDMPGNPERSVQTISTEAGPVEEHRYVLSLKREDMLFLMSYFSAGVPANDEAIEDQLHSVRNALPTIIQKKTGQPATVVSEERLSQNGCKGIGLGIQTTDHITRAKLFSVSGRVYQVMATVPLEGSESPAVHRFLSSFTVTPRRGEK
jgi:hypothetical protein